MHQEQEQLVWLAATTVMQPSPYHLPFSLRPFSLRPFSPHLSFLHPSSPLHLSSPLLPLSFPPLLFSPPLLSSLLLSFPLPRTSCRLGPSSTVPLPVPLLVQLPLL